jgi:hypothetical protein
MYAQRSSLTRSHKVWLVWLCLLVFTALCTAEPAHFHDAPGSEQHCSLCIAAHSLAPPAQVISPAVVPMHCIGVLLVGRTFIPEFETVRSTYIRPPPTV